MTKTIPFTGLVLAAGKGTRMKSNLPKVLHTVLGLPMVEHVVRALKAAGARRPIVVVGHGGESVIERLGESNGYAWQREQLGTGHAVQMAASEIEKGEGPVVIVSGDTPLLTSSAIERLVARFAQENAAFALATTRLADPTGYGRIVRSASGRFERIVEEKDASPEVRQIKEANVGVYCFDRALLLQLLPMLKNENAQGEYYLTDLAEAAAAHGVAVVEVFEDAEEFSGVNDRWQLALAEREARRRILKKHALNGVTLRDIDSITIGPDVEIEPDATIEPCTTISGNTRIGAGCRIGPFTIVDDCQIGRNCLIYSSRLSSAKVGDDVKIGPFANIRPGADIGDRSKVGNFVEIKKSTLGEEVAVSHLTYLGDASVGDRTNIGAGTITCNYDGFAKHRTEIGSDVFIGSNNTIVAPVKIGDDAMTAAGSTVTQDVPSGALAVGRARQENKEQWAVNWRKKKQAR